MGEYPDLVAGGQGATLYLKAGHLLTPLGAVV